MDIVIPSNQQVPKEWHQHRCPYCRPDAQIKVEANTVCQKILRGTQLDYHTFPCMAHIADVRERFGSDILLDTLMDMQQVRRAIHEIPNARVEQREAREATVNADLAAIRQEPE